jgi:hypothetical protein
VTTPAFTKEQLEEWVAHSNQYDDVHHLAAFALSQVGRAEKAEADSDFAEAASVRMASRAVKAEAERDEARREVMELRSLVRALRGEP